MNELRGGMLCVTLALTVPGAALAQQVNTSTDAQAIGDIVVTAQKRSERISEVPISITAVSGDQLARQGITSPADLQKVTPGFTYALSALGAPVYAIRGIGSYTESVDVSPAVSVYVDQVPLSFSRMTPGTALDLERVEVLKGPQGTLFGQNSTGGAINYIAAKPTNQFTAGGDLTYGRYNEIDAGGSVSGPVSDTVTARLAFRTEHRDGWQYAYAPPANVTSQPKNGVRDFNEGRLLVDLRPNDQLKIECNLNGWVDRSDSQAKQMIAFAPIKAVTAGGYTGTPQYPNLQAQIAAYPLAPQNDTAAAFYPGQSLRRDDNFYQASMRADYSLASNVMLTSISAYSKLKVFDPWDESGTIYAVEYGVSKGSISSFSQELRLAGTALANDALNWMIGGNYQHDKTTNLQRVIDNGSDSGIGPFRYFTLDLVNDNKISTEAAFANVEYKLTDTLTAQGSLRYTHRKDDFSGCLFDTGDGGLSATAIGFSNFILHKQQSFAPGDCVTFNDDGTKASIITKRQTEHNLSYRAGLSWKVQPNLMVYANLTKGYKAGAFETVPSIFASEFAPAPQESVLAYEAGFKASFFNKTLGIDGAAFYYDYTNKQLEGYIAVPILGQAPGLVSIPKSAVKGAELSVFWQPIRGFKINVGGTYIDSYVKSDYIAHRAFGGNFDIKGSPFPITPKWQFTSDAEYDVPLTSTLTGYFGGGASHHSSTISAFAGGPLLNIKAYTLLDLRAGIRGADDRWSVQLWGHNVTNEYYWTLAKHAGDTASRNAGMPATFGITFKARY